MWAVPRLWEFYPGICLTTEEKARENLSQGMENLSQVSENLSQGTNEVLQSNTILEYFPYSATCFGWMNHHQTINLQKFNFCEVMPDDDSLSRNM